MYTDEWKYIKKVYNVIINDMNSRPNLQNWAALIKNTLSSLGFFEVWLSRGVGDIKIFFISKTKT